jgi:hypothetical protein
MNQGVFMDWRDRRSIDEMHFGAEEKDAATRADVCTRVRDILRTCGVKVADDIAELGCTGFAAPGNDSTMPLDAILRIGRFLRLGLAGGGVGLPCFVPPTRYCLIHETIGGLESGQEAHHVEMVESISRELTAVEQTVTRVIEAARNSGKNKTGDQIAHAVEVFADPTHVLNDSEPFVVTEEVPQAMQTAQNWKCPEHTVMKWNCRYCAAQAVVEGPLEPTYTVESNAADLEIEHVAALAVPAYLADCEKMEAKMVLVFVHIATFTRKLARD